MAPCSLVFTNISYVPAASVARLYSGISAAKDAGIHLHIILTLEATIPNFHVSLHLTEITFVLQVISSVVLIFVPMLLYWICNPDDQHIYSRNNTDGAGSRVQKEEEDDEKKRKTHEILVKGVTGGYTL
jgi:hypothetical protein